MELGLHCLQVLAEAQAGEQVDLPVGEARLHPLLQQLQHILEATEGKETDKLLNEWKIVFLSKT